MKGVLSWGIILLYIPWENRKNYTPAQLGIYGFQDIVGYIKLQTTGEISQTADNSVESDLAGDLEET